MVKPRNRFRKNILKDLPPCLRIVYDRTCFRPTKTCNYMVLISKCRTEVDTREYCLAPDLSGWTHPKTLAGIVLNAVHTVDEATLYPVFSSDETKMLPPRTMLGLLVYCYSTGVYRSENIEHRIAMDEILQFLCAGSAPNSALIRRFRHLNRAAIEQCLEKVCLVVWKVKHGTWQRPSLDRSSHANSSYAHRIDPLFQTQIICEVKERLNKAERLDYGHVEDNPFEAAVA